CAFASTMTSLASTTTTPSCEHSSASASRACAVRRCATSRSIIALILSRITPIAASNALGARVLPVQEPVTCGVVHQQIDLLVDLGRVVIERVPVYFGCCALNEPTHKRSSRLRPHAARFPPPAWRGRIGSVQPRSEGLRQAKR